MSNSSSKTITEADYIIVGHGIAGALLGYFLEQEGKTCLYIDEPQQQAATLVAAGIINPITGRRLVKAWRVADLIPVARQTYQQLEAELGIQIYHERPLIRTLFNRGDENNWQARMLDETYAPYFRKEPKIGRIADATHAAFTYLEVAQTAQVSIGQLASALQERRTAEGCFLAEAFQPDELEIYSDHVKYRSTSAQKMVFCEGWRGRFNPWFGHLPFGGNKGEILLVRLPEVKLERMFKHRIFVVPFRDDLYWIGSTSDNQFTAENPSSDGRTYLEGRLSEVLTTPYEVVAHQAAVRPTVKDRRPFLGQHTQYQPLHIFNGMGTKGASLTPYWAQHFVQYLIYHQPLDPEVDIARFNIGAK
ncbi:MAG: FAD-dependent oxidoreductase [Bacteroidota bacterium]